MTSSFTTFTNPVTGLEKVIEGFKNPKLTKSFSNVHELGKQDQILWVLWVIDVKFPTVDFVPPEWISEILLALKISSTPNKVKKALATAKGKSHSKKIEGQIFYKIMQKGITHLQDIEGKDQTPIYRIGGSTPRRDKQFLADIIKSSKGVIKIVDPYYGVNSLLMLEKFDFGKSIQLLTGKLGYGEKQTTFSNELRDFKKEHKKIELAVFPHPQEFHDRYILTKHSVIFLGHGIKDIGGKESFILIFEGNAGKSIISDLEKNFDDRWKNSTIL